MDIVVNVVDVKICESGSEGAVCSSVEVVAETAPVVGAVAYASAGVLGIQQVAQVPLAVRFASVVGGVDQGLVHQGHSLEAEEHRSLTVQAGGLG